MRSKEQTLHQWQSKPPTLRITHTKRFTTSGAGKFSLPVSSIVLQSAARPKPFVATRSNLYWPWMIHDYEVGTPFPLMMNPPPRSSITFPLLHFGTIWGDLILGWWGGGGRVIIRRRGLACIDPLPAEVP